MKDEIRVSVIVPAYNAADTIIRCLDSLMAQSFGGIEIIVVDDGSTDGTADMVRVLAAREPRLRLLQQSHGGRAAARNTGLAAAHGEFLGFVDADDEAMPHMYALLLEQSELTGADLVVGEYVGVSAASGETLFHCTEGNSSLYGTSVAKEPELLLQPGASVCNKLFKADLFVQGGITFPQGLDFEDLAVAYRLMGEASRVEKVPQQIYRYYQGHSGSVMAACDDRYLQVVEALEITNQHFQHTGRFDALRPQLLEANLVHLIIGRYADLMRFGSRATRRRFTKQAFEHLDGAFPGWRRDARVKHIGGSVAKYLVSTNRWLLDIYSDFLFANRGEGYGR